MKETSFTRDDPYLLEDCISIGQLNIIYGNLLFFSALLKQSLVPSWEQAQDIWIEQITEIQGTTQEKIEEELKDIVKRNYRQCFAFQKILERTPAEKDALSQRFRDLLEKYPELDLKESVSVVASEVLQILSPSQKEDVDQTASQFQYKENSSIGDFAGILEGHKKGRKEESEGFLDRLKEELARSSLQSLIIIMNTKN